MVTESGGDVGRTRRSRLRVAARVHVGLDGGYGINVGHEVAGPEPDQWVASDAAAGSRSTGKRARAFEADFHGSGRPAKKTRARARAPSSPPYWRPPAPAATDYRFL